MGRREEGGEDIHRIEGGGEDILRIEGVGEDILRIEGGGEDFLRIEGGGELGMERTGEEEGDGRREDRVAGIEGGVMVVRKGEEEREG